MNSSEIEAAAHSLYPSMGGADARPAEPIRSGVGATPSEIREREASAIYGTTKRQQAVTRWAKHMGLDAGAYNGVDARSRAPEVKYMTAAQASQNHATAMARLRAEFGRDADAALADAVKLARSDRHFARMLEDTRLGNDPATIVQVAQAARRQREQRALVGGAAQGKAKSAGPAPTPAVHLLGRLK